LSGWVVSGFSTSDSIHTSQDAAVAAHGRHFSYSLDGVGDKKKYFMGIKHCPLVALAPPQMTPL